MHRSAPSLLNVSQVEASLTPRRAAREKSRVKSGSIVGFQSRIGRVDMSSQPLGNLRHKLAQIRVKPEEVYEDTEMVRNKRK